MLSTVQNPTLLLQETGDANPHAESMVARYLRRRTSNKPTVGHRAALNEEAFDHRCANAW